MTTRFRPATTAEILAAKRYEIDRGKRVTFRHFTLEYLDLRTETGVAHRDHSSAKIFVNDGKPCVKHHGKVETLTATVVTSESGRDIVFDLRLDSPYLPG